MGKSIFERYAPFIQDYICDRNWRRLSEVQEEAGRAIMDTDKHILIASGTSSGKTEAAYFPILSILSSDPPESIGVLYISPLKALINDQYSRLELILRDSDIPVWPWHGDISRTKKDRALKANRGILQTTPESLESMLDRRPPEVRKLFSDLRFIIIDEVHAMMFAERGQQLSCLITRIERMVKCKPRHIGLSATLGDYDFALDYISMGNPENAMVTGISSGERTISLSVESFDVHAADTEKKQKSEDEKKFFSYLYHCCYRNKCIIFVNSRVGAEYTVSSLKRMAVSLGGPEDIFYEHHGSLSSTVREDTENALREASGALVGVATSTLELGIDIGDLDLTIQIGNPGSCSGFIQRLGRSGRRTGISRMLFLSKNRVDGESEIAGLDNMPWDLLITISIIQLYMEDHWVEADQPRKKAFSLLAHQTLSVLKTYTELTPPQLAGFILTLPAFNGSITKQEYQQLLRYMVDNDYIEELDNGSLIIGTEGEKVVNNYSFYAVFQDMCKFHVVNNNVELGVVDERYDVGQTFLIAGESWRVVSVDIKRNIMYVEKASHTDNTVPWRGSLRDLDTRIVDRMRKVLEEDKIYRYLGENAKEALADARSTAKNSGALNNKVIDAGSRILIIPWCGTKVIRTIAYLLMCGLQKKLQVTSLDTERFYLVVESQLSYDEFVDRCHKLSVDFSDPGLILFETSSVREKIQLRNELCKDKYDFMVPDELLKKEWLYNWNDVPEAVHVLNNL